MAPAPNPPSSEALTGLRVVIAEDEALIRLDLREMLRDEGFDVVGEAADGEQAVALATELRPDLVICDIKMPKMDGIAAAAQITGNRIAPVVMLTAFSQRDLIERARDAGAMAYLIKPFEKRDLLPAIEMATSRFAEIKALEAEVSGLRERLEARKLIERAKGALMTAHAMTEPAAFRWIQRAAMDNRTSMKAVAEHVLAGNADTAEPAGDGAGRRSDVALADHAAPDAPVAPAAAKVSDRAETGRAGSGAISPDVIRSSVPRSAASGE